MDHGHHHAHSHAPATFGRAFAVGIGLNAGFVLFEAGAGIISGSMALVADAGHNLSDVLSLVIAWGASVLSRRPPSARFTYGLKSSSILAAMANAALLMVALGAILIETLRRLVDPAPVEGQTVIAVAAVGILINGATALMFMRGRRHDINIRGAYLHMVADAAVSAGGGGGRAADHADGAQLDRSCHQSGDRRGDRGRHLGAAQGFAEDGPARRAGRDRRSGGAGRA